ncbi:MAG: Mut7-C RNAse domain-containing protein [Gammaproteobacteria bacterium]|nr:Mut7-C RNAse domain-containing protein [Gammaproteobacteria bacterium]
MTSFRHKKSVPRILCDANIEDTAHWLRAAGYDVYVSFVNLSDEQLLKMALKENRVLLIRKQDTVSMSNSNETVIILDSEFLFDQIKQIGQHLAIDWLYKPLSRCMICNTQLQKLNINMWLDLPAEIHDNTETSHACPSCKRIYWAGEQIDKMVGQLQLFKDSQHQH